MAKERMNITIDTETRERLQLIAERKGKSISAVISSWIDGDYDTRIDELKILQEQNRQIFEYRNKIYSEIDKAISDCDFIKAHYLMKKYL